MKSFSRVVAVASFAALCAVSAPSRAAGGAADASASPADPMTSEAKARFQEGLELYRAHKNVEARTKYLQALALSQSASILLNLAVVEYDLLMYPDALRHAKAYVVHPSADPARVEKLKKEMIPELQAKTAHVAVQGQPGEAVFVDGEKVGIAPIPDTVDVAPGEHTVACGTITKTVIVKAGDSATVIVIKETTTYTSTTTNNPRQNPPPASSAQNNGNPPGGETPKPEGRRSTMGWVVPGSLLALGVGGLVGGAVMSSQAGAAHDDGVKARNGQSCVGSSTKECSQAHQFALDEQSDKNASTALYVTGGVLVVGAVAAFVFWPKTSAPQSAYVVPSVAKDGAGVTFRASF